jgi:hypothetical protein
VKVKVLIDRIKSDCASFSSRVAGSAEFENADIEGADMAVPQAFALLVADSPEENQTFGEVVTQYLRERWRVIVVVSNTTDRRGQAATNTLDDIRDELFAGLLGWAPDTDHTPMEYRGGALLAMNRARLFHAFDFETQSILQSN